MMNLKSDGKIKAKEVEPIKNIEVKVKSLQANLNLHIVLLHLTKSGRWILVICQVQ